MYIFLQKGANLERQYEDRVQKMLSELREVSRLILNYIFANDAFVSTAGALVVVTV